MMVFRPSRGFRSMARVEVLVFSAMLASACSDGDPSGVTGSENGDVPVTTQTGPASTNAGRNPLSGAVLFVDPSNHARQTAQIWRSTRPADAALMDRIGNAAQAVWFGGWNADVAAAAANVASTANGAGQLPVLVAYNIPQRDCGSYSAGGANSAEGYRSWIRNFAAGLSGRRAVVILEPDALAAMDCLNSADRIARVSLLAEAVQVLKANATTFVYLDAGHPRWHAAAVIAERLQAANIAAADGFALNVSNFIGSTESVAYGANVSALLSGKHFVIDSSRNGLGSNGEWCNPDGRALGIMPTTSSGHPLVDALLWIKRPGESDGTCNGGPAAGAWWPEYALGLASRATSMSTLAAMVAGN